MQPSFPAHLKTIGQKVDYLSRELMPAKRFDDYIALMRELLHPNVHYIDPVHTYRDREGVLTMLAKYVPRSANGERFEFKLLVDGAEEVIWRWTICLKIRFSPFKFTINGLVHAHVEDGKIVYQREYYDPMESVEVIPIFGRLFKLMLRMG